MSKSTPKTTPSRPNINIPAGQDDYVDRRTGTTWKYFATLENEEELTEVLKKHWLQKYQEHPNTINCRCSRALKTKTRRKNCQFRAVFLKSNSKLYTKEQHNHPIFDKGFSSSDKVYVDVTGQKWNFLTEIRDEQHLREVCQQHWIRKEGTFVYHCKTTGNKAIACPFRAIHIEGVMFSREQHNHEVVTGVEGKAENFMTRKGVVWRLIARDLHDKQQLDLFSSQQMLRFYTIYHGKRRPAIHMFYCQRADKLKCKFRGRFFPDYGNFYVTGKHNHAILKINEGTTPKTPNGRKRKRIESSSEEEDFEEDMDFEDDEDSKDEADSDSEMNEEVQDDHVLSGKLQEIEANILAIGQQNEQNQNLENGLEEIAPSIKVEIEDAMEEWQTALVAGKENAILEEETNENHGNQNETNLEENNGLNQNQAEFDLQFVEEINHQEYKMLPPMKRECDDNSVPKQWPTVTIESEVAGWQWQQTRSQKALLRPVKKEEPEDEEEKPAEVPPPDQPTTSNANNPNPPANPNVGHHKMYLRARKPVNYTEN